MSVTVGIIDNGSATIDQDNKDIVKYVSFQRILNTTLSKLERIRDAYNELPNFTVTEIQKAGLTVYLTNPDNSIYSTEIYDIIDIGKGNYGVGGTPIGTINLRFIAANTVTLADIEDNPETEKLIIDKEDLGEFTLSEYINQLNPAEEFQEVNIAPRLIKIQEFVFGEFFDFASFLFLPAGGIYGLGELQTTDSDFQLLNEYATDSDLEIKIYKFSQLTNTELRSDKIYKLQNDIVQENLDSITFTGDLTIVSGGYDVVTIRSAVPGAIVFKSGVGGCGNFRLKGLSVANTGIGSKALDLVDKNLTAHEIGFSNVNFSDSVSIGKARNFRQIIADDMGFYGCQDGLMLSGAWNGLKYTNFNANGFSAAGTLLKKDVDTTFANRLFIAGNVKFPLGSILIDFVSDNLLSNELLQINSLQAIVGGQINPDLGADLVPNLSANDPKCKWTSNSGFPNSAIQNFVKDNNVSGVYPIDWLKDTYSLTMTGDTVFTESNLPANGKNTQSINIALRTNGFIPTFPEFWEVNLVGTIDDSELNNITVKFIEEEFYIMKIENSLLEYPAPQLTSLEPTSLLPSSTSELILNGVYYKPLTKVKIENAIVNSLEWLSDTKLRLSVTTSAVEEEVDITISNGKTVVFSGILPINLGVVFIPTEEEWENFTGSPLDVSENGTSKISVFNTLNSADWNKEIDYTKNTIVSFKVKASPLGNSTGDIGLIQIQLKKGDGNVFSGLQFPTDGSGITAITYSIRENIASYVQITEPVPKEDYIALMETYEFQIRRINNVTYIYVNNVLKDTYSNVLAQNLKLSVSLKSFNITNIKYIELP